GGQAIVAAVFRAVVQGCSVAAHGGRDQRERSSRRLVGITPEPRARLSREPNAQRHQFGRWGRAQSAPREAREGRLIAGTRDDVRAGRQVIQVYLANDVRLLDEQLGGPERIAQVGAAPLQLRRQGTVENDDAEFSQEWLERIAHHCLSARRKALTSA